jgi:acetyl esterase/lipase
LIDGKEDLLGSLVVVPTTPLVLTTRRNLVALAVALTLVATVVYIRGSDASKLSAPVTAANPAQTTVPGASIAVEPTTAVEPVLSTTTVVAEQATATTVAGELSAEAQLQTTTSIVTQEAAAPPAAPEQRYAIDTEDLITPQFVSQETPNVAYGYAGGQTLYLDLFLPVNAPPARRPAVLFVHGGGFTGGDRNDGQMTAWANSYAQRGFVAASVGYRLLGPSRSGIEAAQNDIQAAVRWLQAATWLNVDTQRIVVVGRSAGAITALNVAFDDESPGGSGYPEYPSRVAAAVSLSGAGYYATPEPGDPPILMFHGTADPTVPYADGSAACSAQRAAGNSCEFIPFQGAGHSLSDAGGQLTNPALEFIVRTLQLQRSAQLAVVRPAVPNEAPAIEDVGEGELIDDEYLFLGDSVETAAAGTNVNAPVPHRWR